MVKFFGNMFQGVRGNLKLLTDPRASQRFRNAPEDQQTIQDRLDRWNALSGRFRTVLDKFFEPFVNFTAVRNAANTAEEFGNSIAYLAERMTPFGQKLIKGFGGLTKTIADNPKLLEFGIRFTGIALAFTLLGGAVLSFLALLSGPAGILAIFGLLATGAFALKGTFTGTSDLFKKTAEEMSTLELVLKSLMTLLGLVKPEEKEKPLFTETTTAQNKVDTEFDKKKSDLDESFNKLISDPDISGPMKFGALVTYTVRSALLEAQREGSKQIIGEADATGMIETAPGHFVPYNVPRESSDPMHRGMPTYDYKGDAVPEGISADIDTPVKLFDPGGAFKVEGAPADSGTPSISADTDTSVKLFDPGGAFAITPKLQQDAADTVDLVSPVDTADTVDLVSPVDTADTVDLVSPVDTADTVDLVSPVDTADTVDLVTPVDTVAPDDSDLDVEPKKRRSRDPRRRQGYSEYTVTTVTQGKPVGDGSDDDGLSNLPLNNSGPVLFPNVLQPDASFHDPAPGAAPVIVQTGDKVANVSLNFSGDSGDLEVLKAQFKQVLLDFEYDARETDPGEDT